jgi:hypothetical protein
MIKETIINPPLAMIIVPLGRDIDVAAVKIKSI